MLSDFISLFQTEYYLKIWAVIFSTWPIWLPLILIGALFNIWITYIRRYWIKSKGSILLEIKLPKIIDRSPQAMEHVFDGLWEPAAISTLAEAVWEGKLRDWFSMEIISIGGEVKFFIWALPRWKNIIESRIYAQYPGAEVSEAKDYSLSVVYDPEKINVWGITTKLNKPDAYPIKTYVDYELHKGGKEQEEIIDPISPVIEYLGSLKPGEQAWIQIMIQAHRKEGLLDAKLIVKPDWREGIKKAITEIIEKNAFIKPEIDKPASLLSLTDDQKETIKSIERNAGKLPFDVMMRMVYTAPKEVYDGSRGIGLIGSTRQFGTHNLNGIRPDWFSALTHPWEDLWDIRKRRNQRTLLDAYKRRSFFNVPYKYLHGRPYVLTSEELATIFHFPGATVTTPTLTRVPSKKAEAPSNLPV